MIRRSLAVALGLLAVTVCPACSFDPGNLAESISDDRARQATPAPSPAADLEPQPTPPPIREGIPTLTIAAATPPPMPTPAPVGLLRPVDFLDDPQGYCVDAAGFGANIHLDAPLQAHTCKSASDDQLFSVMRDGGVMLAEYGLCLVAASTEPASSVNVVACDSNSDGQRFRMDEDGRIFLPLPDEFSLCLGVGSGSGQPGGGRNHLRRDLLAYDCDNVDSDLSTWNMIKE